jgi:hypothetical protein
MYLVKDGARGNMRLRGWLFFSPLGAVVVLYRMEHDPSSRILRRIINNITILVITMTMKRRQHKTALIGPGSTWSGRVDLVGGGKVDGTGKKSEKFVHRIQRCVKKCRAKTPRNANAARGRCRRRRGFHQLIRSYIK